MTLLFNHQATGRTMRALTAYRPLGSGKLRALLLFLPPALLLFTLFVMMPVIEASWYSGFNWNGFGSPKNWIGFDNYRFVFENRAFGLAFRNNILIIAVSLLVQLPLALSLALILAGKFRGAVALRMLFFMPYILAEIATGLIFSFVYDGDYGLLAAIYRLFGAEAPHLLASPQTSMLAILIVIVWKYFGLTRWQNLRYIVIPLLYPTIRLSVFFAIVGSLQLFDLIMPLTRGGPADSSHTMVSFLYTFGVTRMRVGFGSAVGVILFCICVTFAFTYKRWFMRDE